MSCLPLGNSGTLYTSQLNILVISDIKIINYFNEESQYSPKMRDKIFKSTYC